MDRFIVKKWVKSGIAGAILKSNMDRFIDLLCYLKGLYIKF